MDVASPAGIQSDLSGRSDRPPLSSAPASFCGSLPSVTEYDIRLDVRCGHSTVIDVPGLVAERDHPWWNQSLSRVNDCVVRLGVVKGEFHWHHHEAEDELFFVLEGQLLLDVEGGGTVALGPHQGYTVPKGVRHRTRAPERVVMLMVEGAGVRPTGD